MDHRPKILAFAGSTREGSYNKRLLRLASEAVEAAGAAVTLVDLRDYPMPLYDGDLEASTGLPQHAARFRTLMYAHAGLLVASPEYNSGMTAVLKNTIDWASRATADEPTLACFTGKVAGLVSASTTWLGGTRSLAQLRLLLGQMRVLVIPQQVSIPDAAKAFDESGDLRDPARRQSVEQMAGNLVKVVGSLTG